jgi:CheY-like chemotaxis protein
MTARLRVLIIEDEALPAMLLQGFLEDAGHEVVGWATSSEEARLLAQQTRPDLAFIDLHLADGLTGVKVAEELHDVCRHWVFVTANSRMLPLDYAGALGVISKPYSTHGIKGALEYIGQGVHNPPPQCAKPSSFTLAPQYLDRWQ